MKYELINHFKIEIFTLILKIKKLIIVINFKNH